MLAEPPLIEALARDLCQMNSYDPDHLEPGNMCFHSSFDSLKFANAEYDCLFDSDPAYAPDGHNGKDPCMFMWRGYVTKAMALVDGYNITLKEDQT